MMVEEVPCPMECKGSLRKLRCPYCGSHGLWPDRRGRRGEGPASEEREGRKWHWFTCGECDTPFMIIGPKVEAAT